MDIMTKGFETKFKELSHLARHRIDSEVFCQLKLTKRNGRMSNELQLEARMGFCPMKQSSCFGAPALNVGDRRFRAALPCQIEEMHSDIDDLRPPRMRLPAERQDQVILFPNDMEVEMKDVKRRHPGRLEPIAKQ